MKLWRRILAFLDAYEMYPACPICGCVLYVKTMPLHLQQHKPGDPDVVVWHERGSPRKWMG